MSSYGWEVWVAGDEPVGIPLASPLPCMRYAPRALIGRGEGAPDSLSHPVVLHIQLRFSAPVFARQTSIHASM